MYGTSNPKINITNTKTPILDVTRNIPRQINSIIANIIVTKK